PSFPTRRSSDLSSAPLGPGPTSLLSSPGELPPLPRASSCLSWKSSLRFSFCWPVFRRPAADFFKHRKNIPPKLRGIFAHWEMAELLHDGDLRPSNGLGGPQRILGGA